MGAKRFPWFKVQSRLTSHPKYQVLSPSLRGHLTSLWCCAAEQATRGQLPSITEISRHLGQSYVINASRVKHVLDDLTKHGWLDYNHSTGVYSIHDWDYWQSGKGAYSQQSVEPIQQSTQQSTQQFDQQSVERGADNKELTEQLIVPRYTEVQNRQTSFVLDMQNLTKNTRKKSNGNGHVEDTRRMPLLDHINVEMKRLRGVSASGVLSKKDWVQVDAMLKRSKSNPGITLAMLCASFTVWCSSNRTFDKRSSVAHWANNISSYMPVSNTSKPAVIDDSNLEWWHDKKPIDDL